MLWAGKASRGSDNIKALILCWNLTHNAKIHEWMNVLHNVSRCTNYGVYVAAAAGTRLDIINTCQDNADMNGCFYLIRCCYIGNCRVRILISIQLNSTCDSIDWEINYLSCSVSISDLSRFRFENSLVVIEKLHKTRVSELRLSGVSSSTRATVRSRLKMCECSLLRLLMFNIFAQPSRSSSIRTNCSFLSTHGAI